MLMAYGLKIALLIRWLKLACHERAIAQSNIDYKQKTNKK